MADTYDETEVALLEYHVGDFLATSETNDRFNNYYDLPGYPYAFFDGWDRVVGGGGDMFLAYDARVRDHRDDSSPIFMTVTCALSKGQGQLSANITLTDTIVQDDVVVQFVVYEDSVYHNGSYFRHVVRDMLPSEDLTVSSPGESVQLERFFTIDESWDTNYVSAVVFVQSNTTLDVLQAANPIPSNYYFVYNGIGNQHQITSPDTATEFLSEVANIGLEEDTLAISIHRNTPSGWISFFCIGGLCFFDSTEIVLAPAEIESLALHIETNAVEGSGEVTLHLASRGDPHISRSQTFRLLAGIPVLLVDDDDGEDYEQYYETALEADSVSFGTWETKVDAPTADDLASFEAVIWFTGDVSSRTLTVGEREIIESYLGNGGRLFLTGQNIGSTLGGTTFFAYWLHAIYYADDVDSTTLVGVSGDPIADGLTIGIAGGDGANNQDSPSEIGPRDENAVGIFSYGAGSAFGAIRVESEPEDYKVVYFGFGFEGINDAADRQTVMHNVLHWLGLPTSVHEEAGQSMRPQRYLLGQNYPNPFNPTTTIGYALPEDGWVSIQIYNALGQKVATLMDEMQTTGHRTVQWDGRDDFGHQAASGVYICRLEAGGRSFSRRMMLIR